MGERRGSVKFADLLQRKRRSEVQPATGPLGERSELEGKEEEKGRLSHEGDNGGTDGRYELPG